MDTLENDQQRRSLEQLRELTNGADDEVSIGVLSSVDWDVQRAAELIFEGGATHTTASTSRTASASASTSGPSAADLRAMEEFELDDSQQGEYGAPAAPRSRHNANQGGGFALLPRPLLSILAFPLHILSSVFRFIFGILRIPFPRISFSTLNFYRPLGGRPGGTGLSGSRGPDRWLRELEEETGAVSVGVRAARGTSSSVGVGGSTSLNARGGSANQTINWEDGRKYLPDFMVSTYEEFLKTCQREMKIGCVVLVSDEHDDVPEFKRSTLTNSSFVKILYENDILVWGGDVRDREAWSAAEKLQATTYPFVAFISLQPRRNPGGSSASRSTAPPSLTVVSRHQGPSRGIPTPPTSAQTLVTHLERQLLPRVTPFLQRLLASQRERERDRALRDEQDRAFEDSKRRDKERIEARIRKDQEEEQRRREEEAERKREEQRRKDLEVQRKKRELGRVEWRRWTRREVVLGSLNRDVQNGGKEGTMRIAIRLPSGSRVIQPFASDKATLTTLYAFVDAQFIPEDMKVDSDPTLVDGQVGSGEQALERYILSSDAADPAAYASPEEYWGFRVATSYPRVEIPWKQGVKLADVAELKGGGQVVIELVQSGNAGRRSGESSRTSLGGVSANGGAEEGDSDGYDTEDSE